jgi:hypothetical protein
MLTVCADPAELLDRLSAEAARAGGAEDFSRI